MRRGALALVLVFVMLTSSVARAQLVVNDPSVTLRNAITAALKESLFNTQREQRRQLRRMAQRLSVLTPLDKYILPELTMRAELKVPATADRKSTRLNSSHAGLSRMPSSA